MGHELRGAVAAVAFLTRIPVAGRIELDAADVRRAGAVFPLVGAGLGAAVGGIATVLAPGLSPLLAVALAIALGVALTGALHVDALADAADALGARTRERALAIMRDSTIGAFGAAAIAVELLVRAAALTALVRDARALPFAVAAGALSRAAPVLAAAALPYARAEGGTGSSLTGAGRGRAAAAGMIGLAVAVAVAGTDGAVLGAVALALTALLGLGFRRRLGGVTGDALGALAQLTETATLVIAVALAGGAGAR